jgi:hypothetical protein
MAKTWEEMTVLERRWAHLAEATRLRDDMLDMYLQQQDQMNDEEEDTFWITFEGFENSIVKQQQEIDVLSEDLPTPEQISAVRIAKALIPLAFPLELGAPADERKRAEELAEIAVENMDAADEFLDFMAGYAWDETSDAVFMHLNLSFHDQGWEAED